MAKECKHNWVKTGSVIRGRRRLVFLECTICSATDVKLEDL